MFYKFTLFYYISKNDFQKIMIDNKNLNQSIIKAFTVLDAFTNDKKEWGVRELANKTGYNKSTTYRLLSTLVSLNRRHSCCRRLGRQRSNRHRSSTPHPQPLESPSHGVWRIAPDTDQVRAFQRNTHHRRLER